MVLSLAQVAEALSSGKFVKQLPESIQKHGKTMSLAQKQKLAIGSVSALRQWKGDCNLAHRCIDASLDLLVGSGSQVTENTLLQFAKLSTNATTWAIQSTNPVLAVTITDACTRVLHTALKANWEAYGSQVVLQLMQAYVRKLQVIARLKPADTGNGLEMDHLDACEALADVLLQRGLNLSPQLGSMATNSLKQIMGALHKRGDESSLLALANTSCFYGLFLACSNGDTNWGVAVSQFLTSTLTRCAPSALAQTAQACFSSVQKLICDLCPAHGTLQSMLNCSLEACTAAYSGDATRTLAHSQAASKTMALALQQYLTAYCDNTAATLGDQMDSTQQAAHKQLLILTDALLFNCAIALKQQPVAALLSALACGTSTTLLAHGVTSHFSKRIQTLTQLIIVHQMYETLPIVLLPVLATSTRPQDSQTLNGFHFPLLSLTTTLLSTVVQPLCKIDCMGGESCIVYTGETTAPVLCQFLQMAFDEPTTSPSLATTLTVLLATHSMLRHRRGDHVAYQIVSCALARSSDKEVEKHKSKKDHSHINSMLDLLNTFVSQTAIHIGKWVQFSCIESELGDMISTSTTCKDTTRETMTSIDQLTTHVSTITLGSASSALESTKPDAPCLSATMRVALAQLLFSEAKVTTTHLTYTIEMLLTILETNFSSLSLHVQCLAALTLKAAAIAIRNTGDIKTQVLLCKSMIRIAASVSSNGARNVQSLAASALCQPSHRIEEGNSFSHFVYQGKLQGSQPQLLEAFRVCSGGAEDQQGHVHGMSDGIAKASSIICEWAASVLFAGSVQEDFETQLMKSISLSQTHLQQARVKECLAVLAKARQVAEDNHALPISLCIQLHQAQVFRDTLQWNEAQDCLTRVSGMCESYVSSCSASTALGIPTEHAQYHFSVYHGSLQLELEWQKAQLLLLRDTNVMIAQAHLEAATMHAVQLIEAHGHTAAAMQFVWELCGYDSQQECLVNDEVPVPGHLQLHSLARWLHLGSIAAAQLGAMHGKQPLSDTVRLAQDRLQCELSSRLRTKPDMACQITQHCVEWIARHTQQSSEELTWPMLASLPIFHQGTAQTKLKVQECVTMAGTDTGTASDVSTDVESSTAATAEDREAASPSQPQTTRQETQKEMDKEPDEAEEMESGVDDHESRGVDVEPFDRKGRVAALAALRVVDLKPLLKSAGLGVSGRKAELVQRLVEHEYELYNEQKAQANTEHGDASPMPEVETARSSLEEEQDDDDHSVVELENTPEGMLPSSRHSDDADVADAASGIDRMHIATTASGTSTSASKTHEEQDLVEAALRFQPVLSSATHEHQLYHSKSVEQLLYHHHASMGSSYRFNNPSTFTTSPTTCHSSEELDLDAGDDLASQQYTFPTLSAFCQGLEQLPQDVAVCGIAIDGADHIVISRTCRHSHTMLPSGSETPFSCANTQPGTLASILSTSLVFRQRVMRDAKARHPKAMARSGQTDIQSKSVTLSDEMMLNPKSWRGCSSLPQDAGTTDASTLTQPIMGSVGSYTAAIAKFATDTKESIHLPTTTEKEKKQWWQRRRELDSDLKHFVSTLQKSMLGPSRILLAGLPSNPTVVKLMEKNVTKVVSSQFGECEPLSQNRVRELLCCCIGNDLADKTSGVTMYELAMLMTNLVCDASNDQLRACFECITETVSMIKEGEGSPWLSSTVLILQKALMLLPFEAMPCLRNRTVTRLPSIGFLFQFKSQVPKKKVSNGFFMINPDGDLAATQERLCATVSDLGWSGVENQPIPSSQFCDALETSEVVLYCGHGSGRKYIRLSELRESQASSALILMGCSSGRVQPNGMYDPCGMVLEFIQSGVPCVVANLWDVTDKDIDLVTLELLQTLQTTQTTLPKAVAAARKKCRLPYLNGAAPVVFGVPAIMLP
eukprot:m.307010 g.307010  ORF g.307010 m.307010 type:complete len:1889 (+) comp15930_c0_seq3:119-5785(+)